jgi:hypothetical protein
MIDDATVIEPSIALLRVTRGDRAPIDRPLFTWPQELSVGPPGTRCAIVVDEPLLAGAALQLGWDGRQLVVRGEGPGEGLVIGPGAPLRIGDTAIAVEPTERTLTAVLPLPDAPTEVIAAPTEVIAASAAAPRVFRPPRHIASADDETVRSPVEDALKPSVDLLGRLTLRTIWFSLLSLRGRKLALAIGALMIAAGIESGYVLARRRIEAPPLASLPGRAPPAIVIPQVDRFAKRSTDAVLKAAVEAVEAGRTSDAIDAFETLALLENDQGARFMVWLLTHPEVRQRR